MSTEVENSTAAAVVAQGDTVKHEHTHKYRVDQKYEKRDWWRDFMHHSWKPLAATVYLAICIFDFIVVPMWIGVSRSVENEMAMLQQMQGMDVQVQIQMIATYKQHYRWEPNTLKWGGIFHFAFGAILTGVALTGYRGGIGSKPPMGG